MYDEIFFSFASSRFSFSSARDGNKSFCFPWKKSSDRRIFYSSLVFIFVQIYYALYQLFCVQCENIKMTSCDKGTAGRGRGGGGRD